MHRRDFAFDQRLIRLSLFALVIGVLSTASAWLLLAAIRLFTNLFFFQTLSLADRSPADHQLGAWVILVPALGGLIVGLMCRLWHREDSRARHSRGARGDPVRQEPHVAEGGGAEAAVIGNRHRQRWPLRC